MKQVVANKDAILFLYSSVVVVVVFVDVTVVVVAVVWMHMNFIIHSCSFSLSRNRQNIQFW